MQERHSVNVSVAVSLRTLAVRLAVRLTVATVSRRLSANRGSAASEEDWREPAQINDSLSYTEETISLVLLIRLKAFTPLTRLQRRVLEGASIRPEGGQQQTRGGSGVTACNKTNRRNIELFTNDENI